MTNDSLLRVLDISSGVIIIVRCNTSLTRRRVNFMRPESLGGASSWIPGDRR